MFASLLLMMFTPTKWTHHFGVYAGLAGSLAALAAVAVGSRGIRSPRNRTLFAAAVLFLLAMRFTGSNGWWYVSSYGVPWWDKPPSIAGKGFSHAVPRPDGADAAPRGLVPLPRAVRRPAEAVRRRARMLGDPRR